MTFHAPDAETLQEHAAFVRHVARAALAGDAEVEDVVQETWLAALHGGPRDRGALRSWLAGVTRRQAALLIRRRTRERRRLVAVARERGRLTPTGDDGAEALARAEIGHRVVEAVLGLPEIYRTVVLLRYQDDLPPREVARRLDLPVETVRTRARRGLAQLRARLETTERARGADWRASLLLLLPPPAYGVSTIATTLLGAVLVKKWIVIVSLVLILGGAWIAWDPLAAPDAPAAAPGGISARGPAPGAAEAEGSPAATRLRGSGALPSPSSSGLPPGVDLATVDRDRDLHGTVRDDETGEPVGGAELVLIERRWARSATFDRERQAEEGVRATTRSAADGAWRIRLEPGEGADLHVSAAGYAGHHVRAVQAGERVDLRLVRGTALRVRVVDARGQVRSGAHVRAFQANNAVRDGHGFTPRDGVTDERGLCVIGGLPPGAAVLLDVAHPTDGAAMWREARTPASGEVEVEVALPPARTLTGRVTDARTGAPIAGARVGIGWVFDAPVVTDATGHYELPGWTAKGVYEIAVSAEGYAQDEALVGSRQRIDFALAPEDRIRGRVLDAAGRPAAGAQVAAVGSSDETGRQVTSGGTARSDVDGRFEIRGLRHDMAHRLTFVLRGQGRTLLDVAPPPDAGGIRDVGDVRLAEAGVVEGVVQRADGTPVARAAVRLAFRGDLRTVPADLPGSFHDYGLEEERYTDDLGRFVFPDVAPGAYALSVRLPGGSSLARDVELPVDPPRARVTLTVGEARPFTVLVEGPAGTPVDQASVSVSTSDGERVEGTTDASGRAFFELLTEPVSVGVSSEFELSRKRYIDPDEAEVPSGSTELRVLLTPAEVIRGRVVDERDQPLARVTLRAVEAGVQVADSWTRADGSFQLTVPRGARVDVELEGTRLEESAAGFTSHEAFLEGAARGVRAGDEDVLVRARTVPLTGTIRVRVTDPSGRPLPDAIVFANRPGGEGVAVARTGPEGEAVLRELPVAELELLAGRAPRAVGRAWVLPSPARATPSGQLLTLPYRPGAPVEGLVVGADGEPRAGERVEIAYEGGGYHATTDADGRFTAMVPAAVAEVRVTLLPATASGATRPFVRARPGDTDVRLQVE